MPSGRQLARVLLAIVAIAAMSGCECLAPGPRLGRSAAGGMAVGWEIEGSVTVHRVRLEQHGVVRWQIDAIDGTPRVVDVAVPADGFRTSTPFEPPLDASAEATVVVDFTDDRGTSRSEPLVFEPGDVDRVGIAKVAEYSCGLDLRPLFRSLGWLIVGAAAFAVVLLLGTTALVGAIRRAIKGVPLDP